MGRIWRYVDLIPLIFPLVAMCLATYETPGVVASECQQRLQQCSAVSMARIAAQHWLFVSGAGLSIMCSLLLFSHYVLEPSATPSHRARLFAFLCDVCGVVFNRK